MNLDWRLDSRDGVTLVELVVENATTTARRVRVGNRLDGPLWPPRREGVPEAGWDDGGFEGVVAADERLAVGYAIPAEPAEPPAEIVWSERAASAPADPDASAFGKADSTFGIDSGPAIDSKPRVDPTPAIDSTPAGVVRALGDARPPSDAVPSPAALSEGDASDGGGASDEREASNDATATADEAPDGERERPASPPDDALPEPVETWLATVESRAERAESLATVTTLSAAAREVEATGGLPAVERLLAAVGDDREALAAVAERTASLRGRTAAVEDVPLDAFRRLS